MSLTHKFLLYLGIVHLVFAAAAVVFLWPERRMWLLAVEAFFLLSFLVGGRLVRRLTEPVAVIRSGVELLGASDFTTRFTATGQPELDTLIGVYNRMVDTLREARVRNQEQEAFLERLLELSPSGMLLLDVEGRVARSNPAARALLGRSRQELEGKRLDELASGFARALAVLDQGEPRVLPLQGPRRVRAVRLGFMDRGMRRAFILLEELTEELRRSEKAAYGKLIRMMSHEVNNTTGAVNSLLDSCLRYGGGLDDEQREDFRNALEVATRRNQHMNAFMKGFADVVRLPPPRTEPSDVGLLLRDAARLLEQEGRRRRIDFRWQLPGSPVEVKLDRIQMEQALLNIYRNALEAIGQDGSITTRLQARPATISIEDSGGGIPPEVRDQLFTPFFTTKDDGQGIGLTLVQEILLSHGFDFTLESRHDGITVFSIQM